ncbi:MAG: hypothetical protein AAGD35_19850 [Actinomycetota bacterium]
MRTMVGLLAVLVAAMWIVVLTAGESNAGFASNAAAVTFIGAVALGIERIIEVIWLVAGRLKSLGGWWPLDAVRNAALEYEAEAKRLLGSEGPLRDLEEAILLARETAATGEQVAVDQLARLEEIQRIRVGIDGRMDRALQLAPGSARLSLVGRLVAETSALVQQSGEIAVDGLDRTRTTLAASEMVMTEALDVIDAFQDNPARRLASLTIGSIIGLGVAGATNLNIFTATLTDEAGVFGGGTGIALTGIILGFGAGPTHEIVKGLQRYKERKDPSSIIIGRASAPVGGASDVAGGGDAPFAGTFAGPAASMMRTDGPDLGVVVAPSTTTVAAGVTLPPTMHRIRCTD